MIFIIPQILQNPIHIIMHEVLFFCTTLQRLDYGRVSIIRPVVQSASDEQLLAQSLGEFASCGVA